MELLDKLIEETVKIAIDKGIIESRTIIVDATQSACCKRKDKSPERIITAATVTSGDKPDGPELEELVRKSRKAGIKVETVIGDAAYSGKDNLKLANQKVWYKNTRNLRHFYN